MQGEPW